MSIWNGPDQMGGQHAVGFDRGQQYCVPAHDRGDAGAGGRGAFGAQFQRRARAGLCDGERDRAHDLTQPGGAALDWVHAYLHRVEGDLGNAAYWYRRAGKPVTTIPLDEEWAELAAVLLRL